MSLDIFDKDKNKWYKIERGLFGRLHLVELIYINITRFNTGTQLEYSDSNGFVKGVVPKPPPTLNPIQVKIGDDNK